MAQQRKTYFFKSLFQKGTFLVLGGKRAKLEIQKDAKLFIDKKKSFERSSKLPTRRQPASLEFFVVLNLKSGP